MTSGVPQNFDDVFIVELKKLIARAEQITDYIDPYDEYATNEGPVLLDLNNWMRQVEVLFNTDELRAVLSRSFYRVRKMTPPRKSRRAIALQTPEELQDLMEFRKELLKTVDSQITTLKDVLQDYKQQTKLLTINIEKDGLIWRDVKSMYFHKSPNLKTKRMKMLIKLVKSGGSVKTETLRKACSYKNTDLLSQEKRKFNQLLRKKLNLQDDVILGGKERKHSGYELNPIYDVRLN